MNYELFTLFMKRKESIKNSKFCLEQIVIKIVLLIGAILSILQFISNRSLWRDEAMLALNIVNKSHSELLKPLEYLQVAPILFLQIVKIFSKIIPNSEFGLRLFPLISYLLSLFLFCKIVKIIHKNYYTIIFSLSLFVFNATLIYYSSEVKQYMTDVLILTSIYFLILKSYKSEKIKHYSLGIVGAISIFLSNVAPIILFTAGFYLLYKYYLNERKKILNLIGIYIIWLSSFLIYYFIFINNHPLREGMINFWSPYAFMPTNPLTIQFYNFLLTKAIMIIKMNSFSPMIPLFSSHIFQFTNVCLSLLILIGVINIIIKKRIDIIILTLTPLLLQLFLSSFKLYPFDIRLILYTCSCIIIICSYGFDYLINVLIVDTKIERFRLLAIFIPLIMFYFFYKGGEFTIENVEFKKNITFIEQNMHKKDRVYIAFCPVPTFKYYNKTSFIKMDTNNIIYEDGLSNIYYKQVYYSKMNNNVCKNEILKDSVYFSNRMNLLSGRVWFLFDYDSQFLKDYFDTKGKKAIQTYNAHGSVVYLYDFDNSKKIISP